MLRDQLTVAFVSYHLQTLTDKKRHRQSLTVPKWRRRESNPRVQSRNSLIAQRLWNMLQDVGVSWEWNDDANRQQMALGHEELAEVITAWPLLSADLRQAIWRLFAQRT